MKTENHYCDYCGKKTMFDGVKIESLNGLCVELGYSIGGWGSRKDFIVPHSVEVCDECLGKVRAKVKELEGVIESCKQLKPKQLKLNQ